MGKLDETRDIALGQDGDMPPHAPDAVGIRVVAQRLKSRLTTRRGTFAPIGWPNYGTDLRQYVNSKIPAWRVAKDAELECTKDEQVDAVAVAAEYRNGGRSIRLTGAVVCSGVKNFRFTMDITQAAGSLVALQEAA